MIRAALCTTAILWAVEYIVEPDGGFPVLLFMVAQDIFHKIAYAGGGI